MNELKKLDRELTVALTVFSICILILITFSFSQIDDEKIFMADYCEKVELWESDADAGIEPINRAGHPNYKGVVCEQ